MNFHKTTRAVQNSTGRRATETSAREGFPIFFGEKLYAAKWRNYKLHFVW